MKVCPYCGMGLHFEKLHDVVISGRCLKCGLLWEKRIQGQTTTYELIQDGEINGWYEIPAGVLIARDEVAV